MRRAVVVGAGAAGLAAAWTLKTEAAVETLLLEAGDRAGGLIETEHESGWLLEHGPDGMLLSKSAEHIEALGLEDDLLEGGPDPRRAFVCSSRGLAPLPTSLFRFERRALWALLSTELLSPAAKLRLLREPFISPLSDEETVSAFFTRRLGREVAERLVDPMLRGIYGAASESLGMRAVMPRLSDMERRWGSVGVAMLVAPRRPAGGLVSLTAGMGSLVDRLVGEVAAELRLGARVTGLSRGARRSWRVEVCGRGVIEADAVVLACPPRIAARLLAAHDPIAADLLAGINANDVDVVNLGYQADVLNGLQGTGFVVDRAAGRALVACTWSSRKWHGRAPPNHTLLRCVVHAEGRDDLVRLTRDELADVLGIKAAPVIQRVRRRRGALPVYATGHPARVAAIEAHVEALGGLAVAGNAYRGVGVPDCVASGVAAAASLL